MPNFWQFNFADITPFVSGSRGRGIKKINLVKQTLIKTYFIIGSWTKKFFARKNTRDWKIKHFCGNQISRVLPSQIFCGFKRFLTLKYFGRGQYFLWEFSVLAFIEAARLNTTSFRTFSWSINDTVLVCKLLCQVCKLILLCWTIVRVIG